MKKLFIICFVLTFNYLQAQFILLHDIAEGQSSGLEDEFVGFKDKTEDVLYYIGKSNNQKSLYKTDGTHEGTGLALNPSLITNIYSIAFSEDVIYFQDFDQGLKLKLTDGTDAGTYTLDFFTDISYGDIHILKDKVVLVGSNSNNVYATDGTNEGSIFLGELDILDADINFSHNDSIAVFYDMNSAKNFDPMIIYESPAKMTTLEDYLSPYFSAEEYHAAFVFEEFIFIRATIDQKQQYKVININTKEVSQFLPFNHLIDAVKLKNKYILMQELGEFSIDPKTLEVENLIDLRWFDTPILVENEKLYSIGYEGFNIMYLESDGTVEGTTRYENAKVDFNASCYGHAVLGNSLYYLTKTNSFSPLSILRCDLETGEVNVIGEISDSYNDELKHNVFAVNNRLITSAFTEELGLELYVYDGVTNSINVLESLEVTLKNNTVSSFLEYKTDAPILSIEIISCEGKQLLHTKSITDDQLIEVNQLTSGMYYIRFVGAGGYKTLPFLKL